MKEIKKLKYNEPRKRTCLQFFLSVAVNELPSLNLLLKIFNIPISFTRFLFDPPLRLINNYSLKSGWIVAKYLPSRESGEVNILKATIHRDSKE